MAVKSIKLTVGFCLIVLLMFSAAAAIKTFTVQETEFVKFTPEAVDLDGDTIIYQYSEPLDELGEWQTGYNDAGEYEIEIIASDGIEETTRKVKLVVENKNQAPVVTENKIVTKENQLINLKSVISDPDQDALSYVFHPPFDENGLWQTDYEDAGNTLALFTVSDGNFEIEARVEIEILATNQPPLITESFSSQTSVVIKEGENLDFSIEARDNDNQPLTYQWKLDDEIIVLEEAGEHYFGFSSAGEHSLEIIINDGELTTTKIWKIIVENTNRPPVVNHLPVTAKEGEVVILDLPDVDDDGDELSYLIETPFNQEGEWQTNFENSGEYNIAIIVSDGELETDFEFTITVLDVDRKPTINFPKTLEINEGEVKEWGFTAEDPDGDKLTISLNKNIDNLSFDLKDREISWQTDHSTISRSGNYLSKMLNYFRLEHYFLNSKKEIIEVKVCGEKACETQEMELIVYNVNRAPVLNNLSTISVYETEKVELEFSAVDPDGDLVRYYFTNPLGKKNGRWQTDFDDRGIYTVHVTATDGQDSTTVPIQVEVLKNNRAPSLKVDKDEYTINEKQAVMFQVEASDPDSDNLSITLEYLPPGASFNAGTFSWEPNYDTVTNRTRSWWNNFVGNNNFLNRKYGQDQETVWLTFVAADESFDVIHPVKITIKNINQRPEIIDFLPQERIRTTIKKPVVFHAAAKDPDNEKLTYSWYFGLNQDRIKGTDTVERTFLSPGTKKVRVVVSDGTEEIAKEWIVDVEDSEVVKQPGQVVHLQPPPIIKTYVIETEPKPQQNYQQQYQDNYTIGVYYIES